MEKAAAEGKGFGPPPKQPSTTLAPKVSLHIAGLTCIFLPMMYIAR